MSFIESPRFPDQIAHGARGGPGYSTTVALLVSGREQRNQNWTCERHGYEVGFTARTQAQRDLINAYFRMARGKTHAFRFKDFADFQASASEGLLTLVSGSTYQLVKRYTSGGQTEDRIISKPVSGTIAIAGGGTYVIDHATGLVTCTAGAAPTGWTGQFDVPVRFDLDELHWEEVAGGENHWMYIAQSIPLLEVRV